MTCSPCTGDVVDFAMIGHDFSFLPQRHFRRLIESPLVARPKRVSHDCEKYSDEDRRPEVRNETGCEILEV